MTSTGLAMPATILSHGWARVWHPSYAELASEGNTPATRNGAGMVRGAPRTATTSGTSKCSTMASVCVGGGGGGGGGCFVF
eukprot:SAG31_NODE_9554_length_1261_cov_2.375862_1_plen_80_part_10